MKRILLIAAAVTTLPFIAATPARAECDGLSSVKLPNNRCVDLTYLTLLGRVRSLNAVSQAQCLKWIQIANAPDIIERTGVRTKQGNFIGNETETKNSSETRSRDYRIAANICSKADDSQDSMLTIESLSTPIQMKIENLLYQVYK